MERHAAKPLENKAAARPVARLRVHAEGIVDVALPVADGADDLAAEIEGGKGFPDGGLSLRHGVAFLLENGSFPEARQDGLGVGMGRRDNAGPL